MSAEVLSPLSFLPCLFIPDSPLGRLVYFGLIKRVWKPLLLHVGFDLLRRAAGLELGSSTLRLILSLYCTQRVSVPMSPSSSNTALHLTIVYLSQSGSSALFCYLSHHHLP